jgi:hypothetical protein
MSLLLKLTVPIITAIVMGCQVVLDYIWHDRRTKEHRRTLTVLQAAVLALLVFSVVAVAVDHRSQEKTVRGLQADLNRARKEVRDYAMGGDSFCYLSLAAFKPGANATSIRLVSMGDYPLYDVQVTVRDLDDVDKLTASKLTGEQLLAAMMRGSTRIGELSPNVSQRFGSLEIRAGAEKRYAVQIEARNGTFMQQIRLRKIEGQWLVATTVHTAAPGKAPAFPQIPVFERVDKGFPLNGHGH